MMMGFYELFELDLPLKSNTRGDVNDYAVAVIGDALSAYFVHLLRQLMMRGVIGGVDGRWRRVCMMQRRYRTTGWRWISSGSSAHQRTNQTVTRMRWVGSGVRTMMVRHLDQAMQYRKKQNKNTWE